MTSESMGIVEAGSLEPAPPCPHPAAAYFAEQLKTLMGQYRVRTPAGKPRKLTPLRLQQMLSAQYPGWRRSQSQMYRLYRAESLPYLDDICVIAEFFGVSPRLFVCDRAL
ncbi:MULTISPECIES: hypothetical protein [Mycobacteriaceae]|uniref:hypothetical protein n=1 Tax=Mycobacteriaceae TaxID=1762 RepID=UPI001E5DAC2F|nr:MULTISPECIES: hypothetical protein [Mycobacteriaceae]